MNNLSKIKLFQMFFRGALTLGTVYASPHDAFIIPELNLKGRVPSSYVSH
jgi:hypothetical protein